MLKYKGYSAKIVFDDNADVFQGEVLHLSDVITFEGETVKELKQAFYDSVDDYLEFCAERGEKPEKPYSGKFVVRTKPEKHKSITALAIKEGKSINTWINDLIDKAIDNNSTSGPSL